ncbi:MAG: hypothetical protein LBT46_02600 [Planctomycetaceae bacterium]|nr:hypothetical protein [Planctomycetaceae bacterium]
MPFHFRNNITFRQALVIGKFGDRLSPYRVIGRCPSLTPLDNTRKKMYNRSIEGSLFAKAGHFVFKWLFRGSGITTALKKSIINAASQFTITSPNIL